MLITKDQFCHFVNRYKHCLEEQDEFITAMQPWFGSPVFRYMQQAVDGLEELLVIVSKCEEDDEIFYWWATDSSEKKITVEHQPGGDIEVYDVETAVGLYEYLYDMYHKE
jgi:hypothetical protein